MPYRWPICPEHSKQQVSTICLAFEQIIDGLIGIYLHGSLALGCFNPSKSDIDVLVVTSSSLTLSERQSLALCCLEQSTAPHPLELSILTVAQLQSWQHPCPFDFHYSESWRDAFQQQIDHDKADVWQDKSPKDTDLAGHITILQHRGYVLAGAPIKAVFPEVPWVDYLDAITADVREALEMLPKNPVYAVLNACRVLAALSERLTSSKQEGGLWALSKLPASHHKLISSMLQHYTSEAHEQPEIPAGLEHFTSYARQALQEYGY